MAHRALRPRDGDDASALALVIRCAAVVGGHRDRSAYAVHDLASDRQTRAGRLPLVSTVKRDEETEDPFVELRIHPRTIVRDVDDHTVRIAREVDHDPPPSAMMMNDG